MMLTCSETLHDRIERLFGVLVVNFFFNWLAGYLLKRGADALLNLRSENDLWGRIAGEMESWRIKLPVGCELLAIEALFNPRTTSGPNDLPEEPKAVIDSISKGAIPTVDQWTTAFLQQWNYVRSRIVEPQNFFLLDEDTARQHCRILAEKVHSECVKDDGLFKQDIYKRTVETGLIVRELLARDKAREQGYNYVSLGAAPIESAEPSSSPCHAEIEQAWEFVKKGQPDVAVAKLNELEARRGNLTPRERYRIAANRGLALQEMDKYEEAAREFIACKVYDPTYDKARCFEATGYLMLGETDKCYELAKDITRDFPESAQAYALQIRSAPASLTFNEVEDLVPVRHRTDEQVLFALSTRAANGHVLEAAERYARKLCESDEPSATAKAHLGSLIVGSTIMRVAPLLSDSPPVDNERLKEAIELLKSAQSRFAIQGARESESQCHYHLGRAYDFLGNSDRAEAEFRAAHSANSTDVRFTTQLAIHLYDESNPQRAIELLRGVHASDESLSAPTMLAQMLWKRAAGDDRAEAISVLEQALERFPGSTQTANSEFIDTLISLYQQCDRTVHAELLIENVSGHLGRVEYLTLESSIKRRSGKAEAAKEAILQAVTSLTGQTESWHRHLVVRELIQQSLYAEAFDLLRSLVPTTCIALDTANLVACARELEQDDFLLGFLESLRINGVFDADYVDLELGLREHYHAGEQCIEIIEHLLATDAGDDEFRRQLRVRLAFLGINYDRPELVETDIEKLPSATTASPYMGFLVVQLLCQQNKVEEGREYAYQLVRGNPESAWAYKALIGSYLIEKSVGPIEHPDKVAMGTAVQYRDDITGEVAWAVLEDGPKPDMNRSEYRADHHVFGDALDKKIGDKFYLARGMQDRTATIIEILDKKVYRFNRCLEEYQTRFDDKFLSAVRMPRDEQGELDLTPIIEALKERANEIDRLDEIYRTHPFSAVTYSVVLQGEIADVFRHLAAHNLPVRCCEGSADEFAASETFLSTRQAKLVVDPSAAAVIMLTGAHKHLRLLAGLGIELVVTRGLMLRLQSAIENETRLSGNGTLAYVESQLMFFESTPQEKAARVGQLTDLVSALEANAVIVDGLPLAKYDPAQRKNLRSLVGWDTAEAIAVATAVQAGIWTDDFAVAIIAGSEQNIPRVWTQSVFKTLMERKLLGKHEFETTTAELLSVNLVTTTWSAETLIAAGKSSHWDYNVAPMRQCIDLLGSVNIPIDTRLAITMQFFQLLPQSTCPQDLLAIIIQRSLTALGDNDAVRNLWSLIQRAWGGNTSWKAFVYAEFNAWLRFNH